MWYHAIGHYGSKKRYWWHRKRDDLIQDVLVPFVSKQVRRLSREGIPSLFNFGAADYITIVKTAEKLTPKTRPVPSELHDSNFVEKHCATNDFLKEMALLTSSPRARSLLEQAMSPLKKQIFVIMKFGDDLLDSAYEGVIKPLGKEFGLAVQRVDEIQDSGNITQQILESISSSAFILADLTGERPNCYYEAGFAHALGKEIIFSVKKGDDIHFDLAAYRFITWKTEADYRKQLRERLESLNAKGGR